MKNYEEIQNYIVQSEGIFFTEDFKKEGIDKYFINKLIAEGLIERYKRGIYLRCDVFEDEYYITQRRNPTVIYSYNTAMYLHHMTERTPTKIDVTVYSGYNASHLSKDINVHFIQKRNLHLGVIKLKTPNGFEVAVYNLERITCDLINERNTGIDKEQINKFLRMVFFENKLDTVTLIEYAKKLKCEKKVRKIMEVLS